MVEGIEGYHLTLDCWDAQCRPGAAMRFMRAALEQTGLTLVTVSLHEGWLSWWYRLTAQPLPRCNLFAIIAESHIAVHFEGSEGHLDVFSCREFNWVPVLRIASLCFGGRWRATWGRRSVRE